MNDIDEKDVLDETEFSDEEKTKVLPIIKKHQGKETKKTVNLFTFCFITVLYVAILVCGILSLKGIAVLYDTEPLMQFSGRWFIALFVSYGIFFFAVSPFKLSLTLRKAGFALSTLAYAGMQLYPLLYVIEHKDVYKPIRNIGTLNFFNGDTLCYIIIACSFVFTLLIYLTSWLEFDFSKTDKMKFLSKDTITGIIGFLHWFFVNLLVLIYRSGMILIKFKEKTLSWFLIIVLPISILFAPYLAEFFALVVILNVILWIAYSFVSGLILNPSYSSDPNTITIINSMGCEVELTECSDGRYVDSYFNYYHDNGDGTVSED